MAGPSTDPMHLQNNDSQLQYLVDAMFACCIPEQVDIIQAGIGYASRIYSRALATLPGSHSKG